MEIQTLQYQRKDSNGYIKIKVDDEYIFEHKYIMEQYLHRKIKPEERIHHIDSNKKNNHISNLVIFPNNKSHVHFHRQIKQFGMTRPRILEINNLKVLMLKERFKNDKNKKI